VFLLIPLTLPTLMLGVLDIKDVDADISPSTTSSRNLLQISLSGSISQAQEQ
jgi:hypothetical protein